jgi:SAM-dependent methyltransferase
MSDLVPVDFDQRDLRERFLAKRENPVSLNNQLDSPALLSMLGELKSQRILEIGCGAGSLAALLAERGVASYLGVDLSSEMISIARQRVQTRGFEFRAMNVERDPLPSSEFNAIVSALTFHFLEDLSSVLHKVLASLASGGQLVFSVRHPIRTCNPAGLDGDGLGWEVRSYFDEGPREITWHDHRVVIYHRTFETLISALVRSGLVVRRVAELTPTPDNVLDDDRDHLFVPGFIHFHCVKP